MKPVKNPQHPLAGYWRMTPNKPGYPQYWPYIYPQQDTSAAPFEWSAVGWYFWAFYFLAIFGSFLLGCFRGLHRYRGRYHREHGYRSTYY